MVGTEDVESFLIRMDLEYEEIDEGMFLVRSGEESLPVVVHHTPPLLLLRLKLMDLPPDEEGDAGLARLYRELLELNAAEVVHGAYAIEGAELVLTDALQLETLGFADLQASLESLPMAASSHMERIKSLASPKVEG